MTNDRQILLWEGTNIHRQILACTIHNTHASLNNASLFRLVLNFNKTIEIYAEHETNLKITKHKQIYEERAQTASLNIGL